MPRNPAGMSLCRAPCCGKPPLDPACGYIVERIIGCRRQSICYEGQLQFCDIQPHLCPPLSLRDIHVACIEPCAMQTSCGCGRLPLRVTLACGLIDSTGCRALATAVIQVSAESYDVTDFCGANVRRGAQATLARACFCPPFCFDICLYLDLTTVFSRFEAMGASPSCHAPCPPMPLYPRPAPMPYGKHFHGFPGKNS